MTWLDFFSSILFFKQKPNELKEVTQKRKANVVEILHKMHFLNEIKFLNWVILYQYLMFWA